MTDFLTLDDLPNVTGKVILVRGDIDVPMQNGKVTDDTRLRALIPTLNELSGLDAKVIVMGHLGRPEGKAVESLSAAPIAEALSQIIDKPIPMIGDGTSNEAAEKIKSMKNGDIALIENLRFHAGETKNDTDFAQKLARLANIYVNNAFASAHRAHASVEAITKHLPAYAGRLIEQEIEALSSVLHNPEHPVIAIVGGAKISTKLDILNALIKKMDYIILGGGMANTFLCAEGHDVGASLCEQDMIQNAKDIIAAAKRSDCKIVLPVDVVVAKEFKENTAHETVLNADIQSDDMALDLGEASIKHMKILLDGAKTLLWNGPLGAFEITPFDKATAEIARHAAELTVEGKLKTIAGGGDTAAALNHAGIANEFSYISTAGGAFLEYIEGKTLPAIAALSAAKKKAAA